MSPTILPLREATLTRLAMRAEIPRYDRRALRPSVVHIGVGHFHRSHQALYLDDLAQEGISRDWGIVGVGVRNPAIRAALLPQDRLYTLVQRDADGGSARVIGAMTRYLHAADEPQAVVAALADPRTRMVTLTITAGGYRESDARGARSPLTWIVEALARRRRAGAPPFTVVSCDNMPANGAATRAAMLAIAVRRDEGLARWIDTHGAFPNTMVDRITPQTTDAHREFVAARFGIDDRWPVVTEPFRQWIVEDAFCDDRPPLDQVGVRFVADVRPYALAKTRLLNAAHCALGHIGVLMGHRWIHELMADEAIRAFARRLMQQEVVPLLPTVIGMPLGRYTDTLLVRLADPHTPDQLSRLCRSGSVKVPGHVLPSIADARARGRAHPMLTLAVAAWVRFLHGVDERGMPITVEDPMRRRLRALVRAAPGDPRAVLRVCDRSGELASDEGFVAEVADSLQRIIRLGVRGAVRQALDADRAARRPAPGSALGPRVWPSPLSG